MHRQSSWKSRSAMSATLGLLLPLLAGCGSNGSGGSPSNPTAPTLPTSQAGTMVVVASIAADDASGSMSTSFTVSLADTGTGAAASGATVEFSTPVER
jgi:hypothetical protein